MGILNSGHGRFICVLSVLVAFGCSTKNQNSKDTKKGVDFVYSNVKNEKAASLLSEFQEELMKDTPDRHKTVSILRNARDEMVKSGESESQVLSAEFSLANQLYQCGKNDGDNAMIDESKGLYMKLSKCNDSGYKDSAIMNLDKRFNIKVK